MNLYAEWTSAATTARNIASSHKPITTIPPMPSMRSGYADAA